MTNRTTELAIPTAIKPKPTKAEIIDAMVEIAEEKFLEEYNSNTAAHKKCEDDLEKECLKRFKKTFDKTKKSLSTYSRYATFGYVRISVEIKPETHGDDLKAMFAEHKRLEKLRNVTFNRSATKRFIQQQLQPPGMDRQSRVDSLLENQEMREHLTTVLEKISAPAVPQLTGGVVDV